MNKSSPASRHTRFATRRGRVWMQKGHEPVRLRFFTDEDAMPEERVICLLELDVVLREGLSLATGVFFVRKTPMHDHGGVLEVLMPLDGSIRVRQSYEVHTFAPGEFAFVNNGRMHCIESMEEHGCHVASICIRLEDHEAQLEGITHTEFSSRAAGSGLQAFAEGRRAQDQRFREAVTVCLLRTVTGKMRQEDLAQMGYHLLCLALTDYLSIFYKKGRQWYLGSYQFKRLMRTVSYVAENYRSRISVSDILAREYISRTYFSQLWVKHFDQPFSEYLQVKRLEYSEGTLLSGNLSLEEISKRVGFSAVRYYYKHFLKCYGCKPLEYKAKAIAYQERAKPAEALAPQPAQQLLKAFSATAVQPLHHLSTQIAPLTPVEVFHSVQQEASKHFPLEQWPLSSTRIVLSEEHSFFPGESGSGFNLPRLTERLQLAEMLQMSVQLTLQGSMLKRTDLQGALRQLQEHMASYFGQQITESWEYVFLLTRPEELREVSCVYTLLRRGNERVKLLLEYIM